MSKHNTITVLVTGAGGFLGAHAVRALMQEPRAVVIAAARAREGVPREFTGEVRVGDLRDAAYRDALLKDVDVVCHAASWAAMWNHRRQERALFFDPARALIDDAVRHRIKRFILTSTIAIGAKPRGGAACDDFAPGRKTRYWPHLDFLVDLEHHLRARAGAGTQMVTLRLGHFVGLGNRLGLVPALVPRLRTHLVPWLAGGRRPLPLIADSDLGQGFARAALAEKLEPFESFNICGAESPTLREVVHFIAREARLPLPHYSVPYPAGYAFGWLMETLNPLLPGDPFLTRSIVHLCEGWTGSNAYAQSKLGYRPQKDWRVAVREHLAELAVQGGAWPRLSQPIRRAL